jgi:hypothetical protein
MTPDEMEALSAITRKLAVATPDTPQNQKESKPAIERAAASPRPRIDPKAASQPAR